MGTKLMGFVVFFLLLPSKVKADTINDLQYGGAKMAHYAFECASSRAPLPSIIVQHEWPHDYDLKQSTSTQLFSSCPADQPGFDQVSHALPCRLCGNVAGHCRPTPDGGNTTTATSTTLNTFTTTTATTTTAETQYIYI